MPESATPPRRARRRPHREPVAARRRRLARHLAAPRPTIRARGRRVLRRRAFARRALRRAGVARDAGRGSPRRRKVPRAFADVNWRSLAGGARTRSGVRYSLCLVLLVAAAFPAAARGGVNPQTAGLQVALRAYGLYAGPIDGIAGPATRRGVEQFQRRVGLRPDGVAGPATRRAFGPLGRPLFGRRTLNRGVFGWDVSVLQFLLARRGELVPVTGYFDSRTEPAPRHF